jgi:hypothetical protein
MITMVVKPRLKLVVLLESRRNEPGYKTKAQVRKVLNMDDRIHSIVPATVGEITNKDIVIFPYHVYLKTPRKKKV